MKTVWISYFWLLRDTDFLWLEALTALVNNTIKFFLIIQSIILYYVPFVKNIWIPKKG